MSGTRPAHTTPARSSSMSLYDNGLAGVPAAMTILLFTAVLALAWSHAKLLGNDEFLSFYTDSVPTFADVVHVQLHTPISLDPPTYHLLSHLCMDTLGRTATALRLPSLLGFLLMQASLFFLVRRLAGHRAAVIAMTLPLCTAGFHYAVEGRPYALLLGLYAASLTSWFFATQTNTGLGAPPSPRSLRRRWGRTLLRFGLALTLATAITSHYFGVLILLPVCVGEAIRTQDRKQIDWPMLVTLAAGFLGIVLIAPFRAALAPYQHHYYTGTVNLRNISQGYRELFVRYNDWPMFQQRLSAVLLTVVVFALIFATAGRYRTRPAKKPACLWAALLTLALLPCFGYLFGKFVTHTMEVRYVVAALIPFVISLTILLEAHLRSTRFFYTVFGTALAVAITISAIEIHTEQRTTEHWLAAIQQPLYPTPASTAEPIYIQTLSDYFLRTYYTTDPALRNRYALLYDADRELHWLHHDTNAVTAEYLGQFTPLRTARYADMAATRSALALVAEPGGWNWLLPELENQPNLRIVPLRSIGELQLVRIQWFPFPAVDPGRNTDVDHGFRPSDTRTAPSPRSAKDL